MNNNITEKEIFCKSCGETIKTKLYPRITVEKNLRMRSKLFDGSLLCAKCPSCKSETQLMYPLVYSDIKRKFMVCLIPQLERFCTVDDELESEYPELSGIIRRAVPDINSLKEKIYCFENGLDDMALEIAKLAVSRTVADKLGVKRVDKAFLSMYDIENNTMGFTFFANENKEPYLQSARLELYAKAVQIVNRVATKDKQREGFLKIDREWADNIIYRYNAERFE